MFSTLSKTNFSFSVTFTLSSANAVNLDQSKILSFGKELMIKIRLSMFIKFPILLIFTEIVMGVHKLNEKIDGQTQHYNV